MRRGLLSLVAVFGLAGCDQLFPEFTGMPADLAGVGDGGSDLGPTVLHGQVCILADLRAPSSCKNVATGRRVTIEENRAAADVAGDGSFQISLTGVSDRVTLAVIDGPGMAGRSTPTISVLSGTTLAGARAQGVLLPVVDTQTMASLQLANGAAQDPVRGAIVAWILDGSGKAVRGASATRIADATGPLYDSPATSGLTDGVSAGAFGALGFLDLAPGNTAVTIAAPIDANVVGDSFSIPVRGGAITLSALQLPSR